MAYRTTKETALCSTGHSGNGILFIGRGLAYHKMEETDLLRLKRGPVDREGLDGTGDGNEAWRTAQRRKQTSYVRNGVLLIGRGLAYRKMEETDLLRSKRGSC